MPRTTTTAASALALAAALAAPANAQSDPVTFTTVYNIGTVTPGSIFDIPTAVTATQVGDGNTTSGDAFITPLFLAGDTLGSNSQLNLFDDGMILRDFTAGTFDATDSNIEVNITGGTVGAIFNANAGTTINISGGTVGVQADANAGSAVNISGGIVGVQADANAGSTINISGGNVGSSFDALPGSTINIAGGSFELNGAPVADLSGGFGETATAELFTGVLEDGTVFIVASEAADDFAPGTTTLQHVAVAPSAIPGVLSSGSFNQGVRAGETLTVTGDGALGDNFAVVAGTLNIENGSAGNGLEVAFGEVNISGGIVGSSFDAYSGSTVNISGGTVSSAFDAFSGSTVNISGGAVGGTFAAEPGSTVNITGGVVGDGLLAINTTLNISGGTVGLSTFGNAIIVTSGAMINISGGTVLNNINLFDGTVTISGGTFGFPGSATGGVFSVFADSTVNIFGTAFFLDGAELTALELDEPVTITDRDVTLTALLADGSIAELDLDSTLSVNGNAFFSPDATLTVTLVEAPCPADTNNDNTIGPEDLFTVLANFDQATANGPADGDVAPFPNGDGVIDPEDLFFVLANFGTTCN